MTVRRKRSGRNGKIKRIKTSTSKLPLNTELNWQCTTNEKCTRSEPSGRKGKTRSLWTSSGRDRKSPRKTGLKTKDPSRRRGRRWARQQLMIISSSWKGSLNWWTLGRTETFIKWARGVAKVSRRLEKRSSSSLIGELWRASAGNPSFGAFSAIWTTTTTKASLKKTMKTAKGIKTWLNWPPWKRKFKLTEIVYLSLRRCVSTITPEIACTTVTKNQTTPKRSKIKNILAINIRKLPNKLKKRD